MTLSLRMTAAALRASWQRSRSSPAALNRRTSMAAGSLTARILGCSWAVGAPARPPESAALATSTTTARSTAPTWDFCCRAGRSATNSPGHKYTRPVVPPPDALEPGPHEDLGALLRRAADGEAEAWRAIVIHYSPRVY